MTPLDSIVLGIIEGFTEFLPVSSTAHLILLSRILGLETTEFLKSFEIVIQLGAITAVVFLYWQTLISKWELNKKIIVAFIPTALIGLVFYGLVKEVFLENHLVSIVALALGGLVLIVFEQFHKESGEALGLENITYKNAIIIGLFQSIAIVPGISRAAATIIGGLLFGINRKAIVEFSFLLAIPTMVAATGFDLTKSATSFSSGDFVNLTIGFVASFITAMFAIKFLLKFVQNHNFTSFGIYRIVLALAFLFLYS